MRYLTARKRAEGKGASHTGTEHHWHMTVTAVALAFMVPTWVYIFGKALGQSQEQVVAIFARPFPARPQDGDHLRLFPVRRDPCHGAVCPVENRDLRFLK